MNLPASTDLERHLIGQCILDGRMVTRELSVTDFYRHSYQRMWAGICELDENGRTIGAMELYELLKSQPGGDPPPLSEITNLTFGLIHNFRPTEWVAKLKRYAVRRHLLRELSATMIAIEDSDDVGAVLTSLETKLEQVRTGLAEKDERFVSLAEVIEFEVKPALLRLKEGQTTKISTGFPAIDQYLGGGLALTDVFVVAAHTGGGKSAFVLQMALNIGKQGVPVAFLSGEMSNEENGLRALSQEAGFMNLNSCYWLQDSSYEQLLEWADYIKNYPVYFDHKTLDTATLRAHVRAMVKEKEIKVLVVDYLQLLQLGGVNPKTRHEKITEVSLAIKRIAVEFGIALVEVVQYNREGSKSGKASMHDLEASGQIEKDASIIMLIDRENESEHVVMRFEKGRNTGKTEIPGRYEGSKLKFTI